MTDYYIVGTANLRVESTPSMFATDIELVGWCLFDLESDAILHPCLVRRVAKQPE